MTKNRLYIALFGLFMASQALGTNNDVSVDRIREKFAMSGDSKLELAADALDDDGLVQLFNELKKNPDTSKVVKKILKK